jgi:hypothetical protein
MGVAPIHTDGQTDRREYCSNGVSQAEGPKNGESMNVYSIVGVEVNFHLLLLRHLASTPDAFFMHAILKVLNAIQRGGIMLPPGIESPPYDPQTDYLELQ